MFSVGGVGVGVVEGGGAMVVEDEGVAAGEGVDVGGGVVIGRGGVDAFGDGFPEIGELEVVEYPWVVVSDAA